jgi:hypothetical protein
LVHRGATKQSARVRVAAALQVVSKTRILLALILAMTDLPPILQALLDPRTQKKAEQQLNVLSSQQGFLSHLLRLVLDASQLPTIRLSGSVYLKNIAKLRWEEVILT